MAARFLASLALLWWRAWLAAKTSQAPWLLSTLPLGRPVTLPRLFAFSPPLSEGVVLCYSSLSARKPNRFYEYVVLFIQRLTFLCARFVARTDEIVSAGSGGSAPNVVLLTPTTRIRFDDHLAPEK